jgi:aminopeptidase-like protein
MAMLWVMSLADGRHGLLDMAERSGCDFASLRTAALRLVEAGLLKEVPHVARPPRKDAV